MAVILIGFVAPLQFLASVLGFMSRDGIAGTGMGILAGTWLATGLVLLGAQPGSTSHPLGLLLLVSATAMGMLGVVALTAKVVPALVLLTTCARFALTGIQQLTGSPTWRSVAGWTGVALAAIAVYAATALLLEDVRRHTVLPLGRHDGGGTALEGRPDQQVASIWHEPGVRSQL